MPKIKIVGLPKFVIGGNTPDCTAELGPGYVYDEIIQQCVTEEEYRQRRQQTSTQPAASDPYGQDFKYKEEPKFRVDPKLSTGTAKTGPGTGVNVKTTVKVDCPKGFKKDKEGNCVPHNKVSAWTDTLKTGMVLGNALVQAKENKDTEEAFKKKMRNQMFTGMAYSPGKQFTKGNVETVSGIQFPSMMTPPNEGMFANAYFGNAAAQFGGTFLGEEMEPRARIKILETPDAIPQQMKYGGQSSYGLDLGWKIGYTDMAKTSSDHITGSMSEDRSGEEPPVLEAEDNETLYKPGDQTLHRISGKRHSEGGVALTGTQVNSQESDIPSFIFSDTKELKIKDPKVLEYFGIKKFKRGGVTPAEISKKFDLNQFKAVLEDKNKDKLAKDTAQMMLSKNEKKLAELAYVQEMMKGSQPPEFLQEKIEQAKYGGNLDKFIPEYANGGPGPKKKKKATPPAEGTLFTPEQLEAFGKYKKTVISEKAQSGDVKVPHLQGRTKENIYGDITMQDIEDLKKRHPWYFKDKPNWDPTNEADVEDFQKKYNEEYAKKHGYEYFVPKGSKQDRRFNRLDKKLGEYTYNAPALEGEPETPPTTTTTTAPPGTKGPKYICQMNAQGEFEVVQTADSSIGYSSPEEASKNCGKRPQKPPYDYLAPDKVNMLAQAAIFPEMIMPFAPDVQYTPGQLNLEDWRAKAAQRFSTQYAAPAAQLAQYTAPQSLAANLSALAGQTAQQMAGEDIAPTISRNVDRANQFGQQELARQDAINQFNVGQKMKRYEGWAVARQQYQNSLRKYLKDNSDAFTRAWNNRMNLGDINDTNTQFYKDPFSGRNVFYNPNTRGVEGLQGGSDGSDMVGAGTSFNNYYTAYYDQMTNVPQEERVKRAASLANAMVTGQKTSTTRKDKVSGTTTRNSGFDFSRTGNDDTED